MVSSYPSHPSLPTCQRCDAPLFQSESRCRNCGYEQNLQQTQPNIASNGRSGGEQQPSKGLLGRYGTLSNQSNNAYGQTQGQQPQQDQHLFASQMPTLDSPLPSNPSHAPNPQHSLYREQMVIPQPQRPFVSTSLVSGTKTPSSTMENAVRPLQQTPVKNTRIPKTSFVVGIVLLCLALISSSILVYLYFFASPSHQATSGSTAPHVVATPTSPPLFSDNFADNAHQWNLQSYPGQFAVSIQNNALVLESDNNKLLWESVPGTQSYSNFQLSFDSVLSKGSQDNGYGIYIRSTADQNGSLTSYYRFELYGDGTFAIFKSGTNANTAPTRLVDYTSTPVIKKQGAINHIVILAQGNTLQLSVNGTILSTITDTSYTKGTIALFVSNLQNAPAGAQVQFSHLAIYAAS